MTLRLSILAALVVIGLSANEVQAQSFGHYHMPSTLPQFCGLGYGPGHHAPMIRPKDCDPLRVQRYVRVPGCGPCEPLPVQCFYGCNSGGYSPQSHGQLDQILSGSEHGDSSVTPTPTLPVESDTALPLPEPPQLEMLPQE
jgi:hypothetical protein